MKKNIDTHLSFALPVGSRILDTYRILKILNHTQFGFEYLVEAIDNESDKRIYIIKEFFPKDCVIRGDKNKMLLKASLSTEELLNFNFLRKLFHGEAKNLAKIVSSGQINSVKFIELVENRNNTIYMVFLYEEGISLQKYLEKRSKQGQRVLNNEEIYEIINPLLDTLEKISTLGIHHLDIKPENILIKNDGTPVLMGFYASTIYYDEHSKKYRNIYTYEYASPEQVSIGDISEVDTRSDIYSMGVLLYYLITDMLPPQAYERKKLGKDDPYVSLLKQELPYAYAPAILTAVDKALSVSKKDRFKSSNQFKKALSTVESIPTLAMKKGSKTFWYSLGFIVAFISFFLYWNTEDSLTKTEPKVNAIDKKVTKKVLREDPKVTDMTLSHVSAKEKKEKDNTSKPKQYIPNVESLDTEVPVQRIPSEANISKTTVSNTKQVNVPVKPTLNETKIKIDVKLPVEIGETKIKINGKEFNNGNIPIHRGESYEISIENPYYQSLKVKRSFDELLDFPMQNFILKLGKGKVYLDGLLADTKIRVYKVEEEQTKELTPEITYQNGVYEMVLTSGIEFYMLFDKKMYKSYKTENMILEHGKAVTLAYVLEKKDVTAKDKEIFLPVFEKNSTQEKNNTVQEHSERSKEVKIDSENKKKMNTTVPQKNSANKKISNDKKVVRKKAPQKKKSNKVKKKNEPRTANTSGHTWYCSAKAIGLEKVSAKHADKAIAQQMALRSCERSRTGCKILNCFLLRN